MSPLSRRSPKAWRVALVAALLTSGCAGLPRIDPSGRRFLIWPEPQATAPTLPSQGGNLDVPPVYAGAVPPAAPPPYGAPAYGAPAGPVAVTAQSPADENLTITPSRILAPVGSEVILKAGVCCKDGYLRTNRRIEWMLGQEGSGQFVTVGERGEMDFMRLPWERPNKVDNAYAVGYTTPFNVCLRRGTEDPTDDVQVRTGEAWITVTSASEGVSYVTATAPGSTDWDARRSTATVYWVDAQWKLPPPLPLQPGQTGTLTTTITRQSDGAPVQGWLVRYEVLRGDQARLGYESGQASEATTDANGRASVQVSPTDDQPGSAQVKVTVIRPATSGPMPAPRLEVGGGETVVNWTPTASVPTTPPIGGGVTPPTGGGATPPAPFEPPPTGNDGGTLGTPPAKIGPRVELVLRRASTGPIRVGEPIPVSVELLNTGDTPAENLRIAIDFDRGLSSPQDLQGRYLLERSDLPDLGPGDSSVVDVNFTAVEAGQQCYRVNVSADGMASSVDRQCFTIDRPAPPARPQLRIESALDARKEVGQSLSYIVTVYNDGSTPASNLAVEVLADAQLVATQATGGSRAIDRGLRWEGESIPAGGSVRFDIEFDCVAPSNQAKVTAYALITDSDYEQKTDAVEILPGRPNVPTPAPTQRRDLEGVISSTANPAKVGQPATLNVAITNTSGQPMQNVEYRLRFESQIQPTIPAGATQFQSEVRFPAIPSLAAGETFRFALPYMPVEQGVSTVSLDLRNGATGEPVTATTAISISPR
ncbi:DUF11 domain-containing protein [Botrimarina colliarenosi]|uniref:DUF11 domain-containing protein n=1 Tax=Botrimarina colliarenosi TaxID=2528001 RepID=UPI0018D40462|nr:DUF11 domain-containing protein [Botrimarina colliarenosi]